MKLYLVRHGHKAEGEWWNPAIGGQNDNPLSEQGRIEAEALAARLAPLAPAEIWVSRYGRTMETALPLARTLGLEPRLEPLLDEIDVGIRDRTGEEELGRSYPDFMAAWRAWDRDFTYPGGESGADVVLRARTVLEAARRGGRDVAAISHDGFCRIAACVVLGLQPWERPRFRADTCGLFEFEWSGERSRWEIVRLNAK